MKHKKTQTQQQCLVEAQLMMAEVAKLLQAAGEPALAMAQNQLASRTDSVQTLSRMVDIYA